MKKFLVSLLVLAMCFSLFAGGSSESSDGVVELTFWDNNGSPIRTAIFEHLIEVFEAENPDIKINFVPVPNGEAKSKYSLSIQSHTAPDCGIITETWMSEFIVQNALVDLQPYLDEWEGTQYILPHILKSIRSMDPLGRTFGLSFSQTLPAIWINTQIYREAGLDMPTTWDEVFEDAYVLTDRSKGKYGFTMRGGRGSSQQLEQMLYSYSGIPEAFDENGKSTINAPEHVEFLEKFAALYNVATSEGDITNGSGEIISAFDSGSAAILFHNLGSFGQHRDTLGIENFDAITAINSVAGYPVLVSNGATDCVIFKDSKHQDEAFRWISFVASQYASSYFNDVIGQVPGNRLSLSDPWVDNSPQMKQVAEALINDEATVVTLPFNVTGWSDLHNNVLEKGFQEVLLGMTSAQDYLDNWANSLTQLKSEYDTYMKSLVK